MDKQTKIDLIYLRMAKIWSENSYAIRRKVGCLVVKDRMIISDGYNGTPSGFENVCEDVMCNSEWIHGCKKTAESPSPHIDLCKDCDCAKLVTKPYVLHAEANALTKLARSGNSSKGSTLYITDEPCMECSKLIIQSGVKRVVYARPYRLHGGIELLKRAGIEITQLNIYENDD